MRILVTWRRVLIVVAALGAGGLLFAWSGLFNVAASSGHWAITDWFLHWVMQNSVKTHSMHIETPDISSPALIHRAAGHFETGCVPCHGSPARRQDLTVLEATPPPPPLLNVNEKWLPHHQFWIIKHGIKYTGMPGWVALERDDEIWSMVAFLRALPSMSAERYRKLAFGDVAFMSVKGESADRLLADCARCHGRDGAGRPNDAFPLIGGQGEAYLLNTLRAYAGGDRLSGIMQSAAARGSDADLAVVARHYASQRAAVSTAPLDPALVTQGERIAREGIKGKSVPSCLSCHGAAERARNPHFPNLDGQHASFLETQLLLWQKKARGGGPYGHLMQAVADRLSEDEIAAAAHYFASRSGAR
jgi:cytochrome c553